MRGDDIVVILTSVGTEDQALDIMEAVVRRRFAACVNMVPSVRSMYRWKGKICEDSEYILIIKTLAHQYSDVARTIREINTYELPEILSISLRDADAKFCSWIVQTVEKPKPRARKKKASPKPAKARSKRGERTTEVVH